MSHPFFKGVDTEKMTKKQLDPPFIPNVNNDIDIENFDKKYTEQEVLESVVNESQAKLIDREKDAFKSFGGDHEA